MSAAHERYDHLLANLVPGDVTCVEDIGHSIEITVTKETGLHSGRPRYRVFCASCGDLLHEATTGPAHFVERHLYHYETRR